MGGGCCRCVFERQGTGGRGVRRRVESGECGGELRVESEEEGAEGWWAWLGVQGLRRPQPATADGGRGDHPCERKLCDRCSPPILMFSALCVKLFQSIKQNRGKPNVGKGHTAYSRRLRQFYWYIIIIIGSCFPLATPSQPAPAHTHCRVLKRVAGGESLLDTAGDRALAAPWPCRPRYSHKVHMFFWRKQARQSQQKTRP